MAEANAQAQGTVAVAEVGESDFRVLLEQEFRLKSEYAKNAVQDAVQLLAKEALAHRDLIRDDVIDTVKGVISAIDAKLSEQVNDIIHHEDYQALESAWRGLEFLCKRTETEAMLKIRFMSISKKELTREFETAESRGNWDRSPIFKKIYEDEYGVFGGEPFGCLVGDYYFDHGPQDIAFLKGMARVAAAAHCPFIAGAGPGLLDMDSWDELGSKSDLARIVQPTPWAGWRSLRQSEDSRYIGLAMPRFLARRPYGPTTAPVEEFEFVEDTEGAHSSKYSWCNSAYAMAANITRSFKMYGWCSRIRGVESGGVLEDLPTHSFPTDDGGYAEKCPTEFAITDRREAELSRLGLMPLLHRKNSDMAAFISAQSIQQPAEYDDPDATANARLAARLPYLFATCRFAHYLKCIVRDKIGSFKSREAMEQWLSRWVKQYVDGDPANSTEDYKARKPLSAAQVEVRENESDPGYYSAQFFLRPHYQLEGLTVSLRLVSKLPSEKAQSA